MSKSSLFDLDGVLTRGDTMASLVSRQLVQHPARLLPALPIFLVSLIAHPDSTLKKKANRKLVALALKGMTDTEYALLAETTGRRLAHRAGFPNLRMISICHHAAKRNRTIVVTASEHRLARSFLDAVGLHKVELIASDVGTCRGDLALTLHNVGATKLAHLRTKGLDLASATLYTDSAADSPLAGAAGQTFIVNPRPRSRKALQKAAAKASIIRC
jgi:phosphatidylglycerophosphatase C